MDALKFATWNAAQLLQKSDLIGSLETNYLADIVALGHNPLVDIKAVQDVRFVMKEGVV